MTAMGRKQTLATACPPVQLISLGRVWASEPLPPELVQIRSVLSSAFEYSPCPFGWKVDIALGRGD